MSEDNDNMLPNKENVAGENHHTTIFTTTSSHCIDIPEQKEPSSLKHKWHIRPSTPYKQALVSAPPKDLQQNNDSLSVSNQSMHSSELSTSHLSLSGVSASGKTDDARHQQARAPRKSMLVSKSSLPKSPDIDEVKSVTFQKLDNCADSNVNSRKKNQVWPINSDTIHNDTTKPQRSISAVISDTCFGWRPHRKAQKPQAPTSNEHDSQRPDSNTPDDTHPPASPRQGLCRCSDLSTQHGRRNHAMMIMLMSVIPVVALLIQNSINLSEHSSQLGLHTSVKERILFSVETGNVIHRTQIERGMTALYISSNGNQEIKKHLLQAYTDTDRTLDRLTYWVEEPGYDHLKSIKSYHDWIQQFRDQVLAWPVDNITVSEVISFYSDDNAMITRWVGSSIQQSKSGDLWKTLVGYYMLILSKEQAGVERALGSTFYAQGDFDNKQMLSYLERKILGVTYLDRCKDYSLSITKFLAANFIGQETDLSVMRMREEIMQNTLNGSDVEMGSFWFWNMTEYINLLKDIQDSLATDILTGLQEEVDNLSSALLEAICVMVAALVLFPVVIIAVYRLTSRIQDFAQTLQERTRDLEIERKRSENLLFELLPITVAKKLLNHEEVPPVAYPSVTVFFSDIVGFTSICSKSTPMQVIDMLNSLYRVFDDIIDMHDLYKVETIGGPNLKSWEVKAADVILTTPPIECLLVNTNMGLAPYAQDVLRRVKGSVTLLTMSRIGVTAGDAYMVVSGLPLQNLEGHATEMANMALDVRESISQMTVQHLKGQSLQMRIGLNSGPVVAGVVGHKMPRYCLFGDTVNVASRMESTSLQSTRRELEKRGGFLIRERGKVEIKGKGDMTTYWLDNTLPASGSTH